MKNSKRGSLILIALVLLIIATLIVLELPRLLSLRSQLVVGEVQFKEVYQMRDYIQLRLGTSKDCKFYLKGKDFTTVHDIQDTSSPPFNPCDAVITDNPCGSDQAHKAGPYELTKLSISTPPLVGGAPQPPIVPSAIYSSYRAMMSLKFETPRHLFLRHTFEAQLPIYITVHSAAPKIIAGCYIPWYDASALAEEGALASPTRIVTLEDKYCSERAGSDPAFPFKWDPDKMRCYSPATGYDDPTDEL